MRWISFVGLLSVLSSPVCLGAKIDYVSVDGLIDFTDDIFVGKASFSRVPAQAGGPHRAYITVVTIDEVIKGSLRGRGATFCTRERLMSNENYLFLGNAREATDQNALTIEPLETILIPHGLEINKGATAKAKVELILMKRLELITNQIPMLEDEKKSLQRVLGPGR